MVGVWKTVSSDPNLRFNPKEVLGQGGSSIVYGGLFKENGVTKKIAVKCIQKGKMNMSLIEKEAELMLKARDHSNILRYICYTTDDILLWIVTELCKETLQEWVERKYKEDKEKSKENKDQVVALNERKILHQVTDGLTYLHGLKIVHRDIKPTNILISITGEQTKLADFGISKALSGNNGDFTNSDWSNPNGTKGWMAPELYNNERYDFKVDIFPLGCIFGYTLSKSKHHPFGDDPDERALQIKRKLETKFLAQIDMKEPYSNDCVALKLIQSMVKMEPKERPTAEEIFSHDFFKDCYELTWPKRNPTIRINDGITSNTTELQGASNIPDILADSIIISKIDTLGENDYHQSINNTENIDHGLIQPSENEANTSGSANKYKRHEKMQGLIKERERGDVVSPPILSCN